MQSGRRAGAVTVQAAVAQRTEAGPCLHTTHSSLPRGTRERTLTSVEPGSDSTGYLSVCREWGKAESLSVEVLDLSRKMKALDSPLCWPWLVQLWLRPSRHCPGFPSVAGWTQSPLGQSNVGNLPEDNPVPTSGLPHTTCEGRGSLSNLSLYWKGRVTERKSER